MSLFNRSNKRYTMRQQIKQLIKDLKDADDSQYNKNLICLRLKQILNTK